MNTRLFQSIFNKTFLVDSSFVSKEEMIFAQKMKKVRQYKKVLLPPVYMNTKRDEHLFFCFSCSFLLSFFSLFLRFFFPSFLHFFFRSFLLSFVSSFLLFFVSSFLCLFICSFHRFFFFRVFAEKMVFKFYTPRMRCSR